MTVFIANFDFDNRIAPTANGQGVTLPRPLMERMSPLAGLFLLLADDGDRIRTPGYEPPSVICSGAAPTPRGEIRPLAVDADLGKLVSEGGDPVIAAWGWSPSLLELALESERSSLVPKSIDAVRAVNRRDFLHDATEDAIRHGSIDMTDRVRDALESQPTVQAFDSATAALSALQARTTPCLLKAQFSGFGRGHRRWFPGEVDATLDGWLSRVCRQGGLVVEPLLDLSTEFASHFEIDERGARTIGTSTLLSDRSMQCVGVRSHPPEWSNDDMTFSPLCDFAIEAAIAIGFRGPISIDHAILSTGAVRDVQDINGRRTIGSLAVAGQRRFGRLIAISLADWRPDFEIAGEWSFRGPAGNSATVFFGPPLDGA